jgi:ketosteroid isomerase-like protein
VAHGGPPEHAGCVSRRKADETSAAERLLELQPDRDTRAGWAAQLAALTAVNTRDWPRLRACYTEDVELVDHRPGTAVAHPVDLLRALLDAMPDGRVAIQFLDAGAARATSRQHFYGHDRAGAEAEIAIGQVLTLRDGRIARAELFEPDDEAGMRSRLERLEPDVDWVLPRDSPSATSTVLIPAITTVCGSATPRPFGSSTTAWRRRSVAVFPPSSKCQLQGDVRFRHRCANESRSPRRGQRRVAGEVMAV